MIFPGIELECFYENESTEALSELDLPDVSLTQYDTRNLTFYNISAVGTFFDREDEDKAYGMIHSNGTTYICTLSPGELKFEVDKWIKTYR